MKVIDCYFTYTYKHAKTRSFGGSFADLLSSNFESHDKRDEEEQSEKTNEDVVGYANHMDIAALSFVLNKPRGGQIKAGMFVAEEEEEDDEGEEKLEVYDAVLQTDDTSTLEPPTPSNSANNK